MIGTRAISGSVATRFRNVVIAASPSSMPSSMLTSRMLAPPRTCSSATVERRRRSRPCLISSANFARAGDVGALADHRRSCVSGRIVERLEPAKRVERVGRAGGRARRHARATASAMARMCSGVVPQQPPTMLTRPLVGELARAAPRSSPASRRSSPKRVRQAGVRVAADVARRDRRDSSSTYGRISLRAERAVDADGERLRVRDRRPERVDGLPATACARSCR